MQGEAGYEVETQVLNAALAGVSPSKGHKFALAAVRSFSQFKNAKVLMSRGGDGSVYLSKHRLYDQDGVLVHDDLKAFLSQALQDQGGDATRLQNELASKQLTVARTHCETIYLTVESGSPEVDAYTQIELEYQFEVPSHKLFEYPSISRPRDLDDLNDNAASHFSTDPRGLPVLSAPSYKVSRAVDVARFVALCAEVANENTAFSASRSYRATDMSDGTESTLSMKEIDPDFDRFPCRERRFFNDWRDSSAGRSGARVGVHWALKFSNGVMPWVKNAPRRYANFIPMNAHSARIAKIDSSKGTDSDLAEKLDKLDRRVGVPMAWYFFMLHGNWVRDGAGKRMLRAAEAGVVQMEEHDYQVLKRWERRSYGF